MEQALLHKILSLTLTIKEHYPELSKYLEEMPETIPNQVHPKDVENLKRYCNSLENILSKYILKQ